MEINGQTVNEHDRYDQLGLSPELMRAIEKKGYVEATPIQTGAIPYFMDWKDVIAKAPTGTGKTFAFGIPMVEHIDPENGDIQALVLAPTRELAIQIQDELRDLCAFKEGVRVVCLYGGQPIDKQITQLKKDPQIVVATPGRLMDHMKRRTVRLEKVQTVVLDEADRMLDMGFVRDVTHILDKMPTWASFPPPSPGRCWISPGCTSVSRWRSPSTLTRRTSPTSPSTAWRWTGARRRTPWPGCWPWGAMSG